MELDPSVAGYVRPAFEFRGVTLQPYTAGRKILFHQASLNENGDRNSRGWASIALLFLLTLPVAEARKLAFNRSEYRNRALDWFDGFTDLDKATEEAGELADQIFTFAEQTKVEVGGEGGTDPKNA